MSKTINDPGANPDRIARTLARKRSGASGFHPDKRLRRRRSIGAVRVALKKEFA